MREHLKRSVQIVSHNLQVNALNALKGESEMTDSADSPADLSDCSPAADRRTFLKTAGIAGAAGAVLAGAAHGKFGLAPIASAQAQPAAPKLSTDKWWPSKWGPQDEAGASNHITPQKVLDTTKWIRDGKVYKLGRVYEQGMPLFGNRGFLLR